MAASRFRSNFIDLPSEFAVWPFVDSVDNDTGYLSPGTGKCGAIKYVVLNESQEPSIFVDYDGLNEIVMIPDGEYPAKTGIHLMYLRAYMDEYADNYYDIPFYVTVRACEPIIDASNVMVPAFY